MLVSLYIGYSWTVSRYTTINGQTHSPFNIFNYVKKTGAGMFECCAFPRFPEFKPINGLIFEKATCGFRHKLRFECLQVCLRVMPIRPHSIPCSWASSSSCSLRGRGWKPDNWHLEVSQNREVPKMVGLLLKIIFKKNMTWGVPYFCQTHIYRSWAFQGWGWCWS